MPPPEIIKVEIARRQRGHFNLINHATGFKADVYTTGNDELHQWALQHRKSIKVKGEDYWFAPIEYVIVRKLEYYREGQSEKHLQDIVGMLEVSSGQIDLETLETFVKKRELSREWEKAKRLR